jgi:uncharacterized protein with NRDE domain
VCTIAVVYRAHREFPLIVAANRDEFYRRPASGPEILGASPRLIGGRDLASGGTWLALRQDGAIAAVTNQRTFVPPDPDRRSRGLAVIEVLTAADPVAALAGLDPHAYNGGNFVVGDATRAVIGYLRQDAAAVELETLTPGIHVLANDRLGSPDFPRTERVRALIEPHLALPWPALVPHLRAALADHTQPPEASLPALPPGSPIDRALQIRLEQPCIHTEAYGTRWATIAAIGPGGVHQYLYADGPPCTTELRDGTELLR